MSTAKARDQQAIAFSLHQGLEDVLKDLRRIDKMIPCESSRGGCLMKDVEGRAIIEARKNNLLRFIQTVCRDHIHFGGKLVEAGWTAEQQKRKGKR